MFRFLWVAAALALLLTSGCASLAPFEKFPKSDQDFQLPPGKIEEQFSTVKNFHPDHLAKKEVAATLQQLSEVWGKPSSTEKHWEFAADRFAWLTGTLYAAVDGVSPLLILPIVITPLLAPVLTTQNWAKGDYEIEAVFLSTPLSEKSNLLSWTWRHKGGDPAQKQPRDWLAKNIDRNFVFDSRYSTGGDHVFVTKDPNTTISIGHGTMFSIGYEQKLSNPDYSILGEVGYFYSGFLIPTSGPRLTQIPIELVGRTHFVTFPIELGLGVSYHLNPTISNADVFGNDINFHNAVGTIIEASIRVPFSYRTTLRYEFVSYESDRTRKINGNNFSISLRSYF